MTTSPSTVNWTLTNTQLSSPFGILPHESIAVSSPPGPPSASKPANSVTYDNPFAQHYSNNGTAVSGAGSKTDSWSNTDHSKKSGTQSPINNSSNTIKCIVTEPSISAAHTFFQGTSAFDSDGLATAYSPEDNSAANAPVTLHHQSCIVSTPNITSTNKEYRISQLPERSPVQTTIYLTTATQDKQTTPGNNTTISSRWLHIINFLR